MPAKDQRVCRVVQGEEEKITKLLRQRHDIYATLHSSAQKPKEAWHRDYEASSNQSIDSFGSARSRPITAIQSCETNISIVLRPRQYSVPACVAWIKQLAECSTVFCSGERLRAAYVDDIKAPGMENDKLCILLLVACGLIW
jgi:hypothetical protein